MICETGYKWQNDIDDGTYRYCNKCKYNKGCVFRK